MPNIKKALLRHNDIHNDIYLIHTSIDKPSFGRKRETKFELDLKGVKPQGT